MTTSRDEALDLARDVIRLGRDDEEAEILARAVEAAVRAHHPATSADDRAIVVRLKEEEWLALEPRDAAAALELGYFAGNMHWPVRFDGTSLRIALHGPVQSYLDRLEHLIADGRVRPFEGDLDDYAKLTLTSRKPGAKKGHPGSRRAAPEIGRASCRERVSSPV